MSRHLLTASVIATAVGLALGGCAAQKPTSEGMSGGASGAMAGGMAMPQTKGSLTVLYPTEGATITTTDIPVQVSVSNFKLCGLCVGAPDVEGEGHIHVMYDHMSMGVLFNFYASSQFMLPGQGLAPGNHTLIFDLASNTHENFANTVQKVDINYQPATSAPLPNPLPSSALPSVKIVSPANGATVGPQFNLQLQPTNFTPATTLEGKPNVWGYGHYHVFVDMKMMPGSMGGMMSMAGMIAMPGTNTVPLDLSGWKDGQHTITFMLVHNDHTPIPGAKPAMIMINLTGASGS